MLNRSEAEATSNSEIMRSYYQSRIKGGYSPRATREREATRSVIKSLSMASSKKNDPFGFKFNQIKYKKFRWPLNHFCML